MNNEAQVHSGPAGVTLGELGERETIRRLARHVGAPPPGSLGIGDDCAVVPVEGASWDLVLTSDPILEGRHFLSGDDPARIGRKAVGRVLSDLAAMGAEPMWMLINVVAPSGLPMERLEAAYDGATRLCDRFGAPIIGGDVAHGDKLEFHVFGGGRVPKGRAVLRSGARPGDAIFVTGALGGSRLGRHLDIEPRIREGAWLRDGLWARAMMDVSDGLASDLRRIFEQSGVGAWLDAARIPVSADARRLEGDPIGHALMDGEDFELLFCVAPDRVADFERAWSREFELACTRIGEVTDRKDELMLIGPDGQKRALERGGYEHFIGE